MTPLEVFAILVLAGAIVILLYYYLQDNRKLNLGRMKSDATNLGERVYGEASNLGEKVQGGASNIGEKVSGEGSMSGMGEKLNVSGVSEKVSGMGEKIKGKVSVPISTDNLSHRIDLFLNEQSDQLIEDWDLATKKDLLNWKNVSKWLQLILKLWKNVSTSTWINQTKNWKILRNVWIKSGKS